MSYGDELPDFAGSASPAEGYIYCVRKWNKGLSAKLEVVLCVNPAVPCSENYSCHAGVAFKSSLFDYCLLDLSYTEQNIGHQ